VSQVAIQYFTWCEFEEQVQLAKQTLAAVQASYDLTKSSFDAGATNELDLRTAEAQVQTAKVNILNNERQSEQALNGLVLLVGRPLPAKLPEPRALGAHNVLASIPAGMPSSLLELRPDILQAEHTLKAANANIGAARAAFFPTVTLTGSAGTATAEFSSLFGKNTANWSFSPQITVPIFTGGNLQANLDVAKVSTRIEVANYEKAIQTAFREVADALVGRRTYARQIEAQEALVAAEQKRYELANTRYRQGADTYLNVLSAQQDLYNAQQNLLQTRFDNLSNQVTLYKALGGGWK
jgi:multidrug efflux system outer membrane protein